MSILHMSHMHPLKLKVRERNEETDERYYDKCFLCHENLESDLIYNCGKCQFSVHKSCAELPTEINHPFHPHSLVLIDLYFVAGKLRSPWYKYCCSKSTLAHLMSHGDYEEIELFLEKNEALPCGACGGMNRYSLRPNILPQRPVFDKCEFNLDFKCAFLTPETDKFLRPAALPLQHEHLLIACKNKLKEYSYTCFCCGEDCDEDYYIYVCLECKCLLHETCAALPNHMRHPLHSQHDLILHVAEETEKFFCSICSLNYLRSERMFYSCGMCDFNVDIWCVKLKLADQRKQMDQALPHWCPQHHSLIQCASLKGFPRLCFGCGSYFNDDDPIFVCLQCNFVLDVSCIDPPAEIVHLFHPQHPLKLHISSDPFAKWPPESNCNCCWSRSARYLYVCDNCKFSLDIRCARREPDILSSEIHEHPLALSTNEGTCFYCHRYFQLELVLHCCRSECNYNIHPRCLPSLPETIKHDCHIHPLTLSRSCIKELPDEVRDLDAKFYCYACEGERDLDHPCYSCTYDEDCVFIAHVHCLIIKIVSSMPKWSTDPVSQQNASSVVIEEVPDSNAKGFKDGSAKIEEASLARNAEDVVKEQHDASTTVENEEPPDSTAMGSLYFTAATKNTGNAAVVESASAAVATEGVQGLNLEPNVEEIDQEIAAAEQAIDAWTRKVYQLRGKRHQILANSAKQMLEEN